MDCSVVKPGAEGEQTAYRIRWHATGDVRVDMDSADGARTLLISNEADVRSTSVGTVSPEPVWQPVLEFMSPKILAKHMEGHYGLMRNGGRAAAKTNEFLITGREGHEDVEITVDAKTYLPKVLKKYSGGDRNCILEARFVWNEPIPAELFSPPNLPAERDPAAIQP